MATKQKENRYVNSPQLYLNTVAERLKEIQWSAWRQ